MSEVTLMSLLSTEPSPSPSCSTDDSQFSPPTSPYDKNPKNSHFTYDQVIGSSQYFSCQNDIEHDHFYTKEHARGFFGTARSGYRVEQESSGVETLKDQLMKMDLEESKV